MQRFSIGTSYTSPLDDIEQVEDGELERNARIKTLKCARKLPIKCNLEC